MKFTALILCAFVLAACGNEPAPNIAPTNTPADDSAHRHDHTDAHMEDDKGHAPSKVTFNWDTLTPPLRTGEVVDLKNEKDPATLKPVATPAITVDYKGFRVHFESEKTRARFERKPLKYLNMLGLEPLVDGSVKQVDADSFEPLVTETCPVMVDSEVDPHGTVYLLHRGFKFYFCCWTGCGDAFMQEPAKYYDWYGVVEKDGKLVRKPAEAK